ncbi:MAG: tRNA preQ1(34) S-adenosylmethionine ribosyltransferase-isomerase QueA [Candidatus Gastranaerophilales bacterium]|nr:tRNA preQ1(34) S-adenosylmethionine ribosyltransferase-isomerase QueA [Candidatus Gastranaerophilales bacterium]
MTKNEKKLDNPKYLSAADFDYNLPEELIAQFPLKKRDTSKMMVLKRGENTVEHKIFSDFADYLKKGDVLVLNNTKVLPARLLGEKETGAKIEIFLLHPAGKLENEADTKGKTLWYALIRNLKRLKEGDIVKISDELSVRLLKKGEGANSGPNENLVELIYYGENLDRVLEKYGEIPLPPYIQRENVQEDKNTYQTVFAKIPGSVAAPTAGLHFTPEILAKIEKKGVKTAYVTLNVGLGTFLPVKEDNVLNHKMHTESFEIPEETARIINEARENAQGNIVCVGTTVTRTLEATYKKYGKILPIKDETDIFIYPPYEFKVTDKLLTNFHLPKSTLIMLVSALAGKDFILEAYKKAVNEKYRFFSYGDCMFIDK